MTNPDLDGMAKLERDPNAESVWAENNGGLFQIEIDALNALRPEDFVSLLEDTAGSHFDMDILTATLISWKILTAKTKGTP